MVVLALQVKELREAQRRTKAEQRTHRNPHIFMHFWGYSLLAAGTALLFSSLLARFLLRWGCASLAGPTFPVSIQVWLVFRWCQQADFIKPCQLLISNSLFQNQNGTNRNMTPYPMRHFFFLSTKWKYIFLIFHRFCFTQAPLLSVFYDNKFNKTRII